MLSLTMLIVGDPKVPISDQFGEALKLAELISEKTGRPLNESLANLSAFARGATLPEAPPTQELELRFPQSALRGYSEARFIAFIDRARPGTAYTAPEICNELNMVYPARSKRPTHLMQARGWTDTGVKRGGCHVYQKPAIGIAASR